MVTISLCVFPRYMDACNLSWDEIEWAYAYDGVLIPGGKTMLGRWWRIGESDLFYVFSVPFLAFFPPPPPPSPLPSPSP